MVYSRRSYEALLASWNAQGDPFKDAPKTCAVETAASRSWRVQELVEGSGPTKGHLQ
jgi:hypothetical protein